MTVWIYCPFFVSHLRMILGLASFWKFYQNYDFSEECSNKGGTNEGSCASGFGVCCSCKFNIIPFLLKKLFVDFLAVIKWR